MDECPSGLPEKRHWMQERRINFKGKILPTTIPLGAMDSTPTSQSGAIQELLVAARSYVRLVVTSDANVLHSLLQSCCVAIAHEGRRTQYPCATSCRGTSARCGAINSFHIEAGFFNLRKTTSGREFTRAVALLLLNLLRPGWGCPAQKTMKLLTEVLTTRAIRQTASRIRT